MGELKLEIAEASNPFQLYHLFNFNATFFLSLINGSHKASVLFTAAGGAHLKKEERNKFPDRGRIKKIQRGFALTIIYDGGSDT